MMATEKLMMMMWRGELPDIGPGAPDEYVAMMVESDDDEEASTQRAWQAAGAMLHAMRHTVKKQDGVVSGT